MAETQIYLGSTWGDTGKGEQNYRTVRDAVISKGLKNPEYAAKLLRNPFGVLEHGQVVFNVAPYGAGNAGNNIYLDTGTRVKTHQLPPGALVTPYTLSMLGGLKTINLQTLWEREITKANESGVDIKPGNNLFIDQYATLTLPQDIAFDEALSAYLRGTKQGSGPSHARRKHRVDLRAGDLWNLEHPEVTERLRKGIDLYNENLRARGKKECGFDETIDWLTTWRERYGRDFVVDGEELIQLAVNNPDAFLFINGTQGLCLDGDFGTIGRGVSYGVGVQDAMKGCYLPLNFCDNNDVRIFIVVKGYNTRAGDGLFPGELDSDEAEKLGRIGEEIGVTSGNVRRIGAFNIAELSYQVRQTGPGITSLIITRLDTYGDYMEEAGPQRAVLGYETSGGKVKDHVSFPGEGSEIVWSPEFHWGKISESERRRMIDGGFDKLDPGIQEFAVMVAKYTGAPISGLAMGQYHTDTVTKGLYEETSQVIT